MDMKAVNTGMLHWRWLHPKKTAIHVFTPCGAHSDTCVACLLATRGCWCPPPTLAALQCPLYLRTRLRTCCRYYNARVGSDACTSHACVLRRALVAEPTAKALEHEVAATSPGKRPQSMSENDLNALASKRGLKAERERDAIKLFNALSSHSLAE